MKANTLDNLYSFEDYDVEFHRPGAAKVDLVSWTQNPVQVMALTTNGYTGNYSPRIKAEAIPGLLEDIANTKLQTPMEMVHTLWLLRDVSRAFTHQLVRYRIGTAFVQESMRFLGAKGTYKVLTTVGLPGNSYDIDKYKYESGINKAIAAYHEMVEDGIPSQDARGVLPTNILTNIWFSCSLRTLQNILPQRLCCQAQPGEWQLIVREMRTLIGVHMGTEISDLLKAPYELGRPCGYRASFDRPCTWQKEN